MFNLGHYDKTKQCGMHCDQNFLPIPGIPRNEKLFSSFQLIKAYYSEAIICLELFNVELMFGGIRPTGLEIRA